MATAQPARGASFGLRVVSPFSETCLQNTVSDRIVHSVRGKGPIRGVRKRRGGSGWFRNIQTRSEMKMNALVLLDEGEVPARLARASKNLPTAWDDVLRDPPRSWKKQTKARRQWA